LRLIEAVEVSRVTAEEGLATLGKITQLVSTISDNDRLARGNSGFEEGLEKAVLVNFCFSLEVDEPLAAHLPFERIVGAEVIDGVRTISQAKAPPKAADGVDDGGRVCEVVGVVDQHLLRRLPRSRLIGRENLGRQADPSGPWRCPSPRRSGGV
jgi:hypothetical protein